jgi:hypothetical protein
MAPTKVIVSNRDDILGSVLLALATRCAGQQIAGGMTQEYMRKNGFWMLKFAGQDQVAKVTKFVRDYVPAHMQDLITITPSD